MTKIKIEKNQIIRLKKHVDFEVDGRNGRLTLQFKPFDLFVFFMEDNENTERIEVYPKSLLDLGIQIRLSIHKNDFGISVEEKEPSLPKVNTYEVWIKHEYPASKFLDELRIADPEAIFSSLNQRPFKVMTILEKEQLESFRTVDMTLG
jgi:hypothetical protein